LLFANRQHVFHHHLHPGGAENENLDVGERLGIIGDACHMDVMVGAKTKKEGFHCRAMILFFICYSFFCVADWVGFGPVGPSSTWRSSSVKSSYRD
jgi:hypothetical protein